MPKLGNQTPTNFYLLPYKKTYGQDAIQLYQRSGRKAQKWQAKLVKDILAVNKQGLFVHTKFGYSVPRRNGKNEIVAIVEQWALTAKLRILHTAHRTTTSHSAWERLCVLLASSGFTEGQDYKTTKQYGLEKITFATGGTISFRTRSTKGGLGEGFDLLIIDEAQEYTDDQESALKYVVTDSKNPITVFCGTPPTAVSAGTVFLKMRNETLAGQRKNTGWAEWSVPQMSDVHDISLWYLTNPSMGTILNERKVEDEISGDEIDFNIQRLGLWLTYNQHSAISRTDWDAIKEPKMPQITGKVCVGIKYGHDGARVALSVAVRTVDDKILVEAIDCRTTRAGNDWILGFLVSADVQTIVVDGANGQQLLAASISAMGIKSPILPTVKEIITANAAFEQSLQAKQLCHMGQPSLSEVVSNCDKRPIGANGGFGYRSIREDLDIALLDSVILAHWACMDYRPRKPQRISY